MKHLLIWTVILFGLLGTATWFTMGAGGFKRMVTITGVYSICRPDGYDVACFLDADGSDGGLFCMPLSVIGGECKK